jgi:hypothetical protein
MADIKITRVITIEQSCHKESYTGLNGNKNPPFDQIEAYESSFSIEDIFGSIGTDDEDNIKIFTKVEEVEEVDD